MHGLVFALVFSLTLLCAVGVARADWFSEAALDGVYDNNLSRAVDKSDRKGDFAFAPRISLGQYDQLTDTLGFSLITDIGSGIYTRYDGLDYVNAGLTASLKYKYGLGAYAPWLKGYGTVKYFSYNESMRDGALFSAGVLAGKKIRERMDLQIGYEHENLDARNALFDRKSHAATIKAGFLLTESAQLTLGYAVKRGDVAVYAPADEDTVFSADTFHTPMEIYRVRATTRTISVGLNKTLDSRWWACFSADFSSVRGGGKSYPDTLLKASVRYSY